MEKTIGLQFAGCAETGFDSLLSINWAGRNLSDFMPAKNIMPTRWHILPESTVIIRLMRRLYANSEGSRPSSFGFQMAVRIPVGYRIAEAATGKIVSPAAVLRPILTR